MIPPQIRPDIRQVALVAGEPSGDLLASHLIAALRSYLPNAVFSGIGGPCMAAEGFISNFNYERLAVHGFIDALKRYRELSRMRQELLTQLLANPPDVFIAVDAPDFNLWLERQLFARNIPTVHFISPSVWAWRSGRIKTIRQAVMHMLCLFPFEPAIYHEAGVAASYVGHPLADTFPMTVNSSAARQSLALAEDKTWVALLPGSRVSEVNALASLMIDTAVCLAQQKPDLQFVVPLATPQTAQIFEQILAAHPARSQVSLTRVSGNSKAAMSAADVVVVASGTATLEAALLKRPMVICYRVHSLQYYLMKKMAYLPWVGLPNILCRETVVPEYLQHAATPEALADAVLHWLAHPEACAALQRRFSQLHSTLRCNTAQQAAQIILSVFPEQEKS